MSDPELVVQLNNAWRVMLQPDPSGAFKGRLSILQRLVDGAWCTHFTTRSRAMLLWMIEGKDVGPLDDGTAAALAALPAHVDRPPQGSSAAARRKPRRAPQTPAVQAPPKADQVDQVLVATLSPRWRVIDDGGRQWILQSRHDNHWLARAHCTLRGTLLYRIQTYVIGDIDPETRARLNALPKRIDWTQSDAMNVEGNQSVLSRE